MRALHRNNNHYFTGPIKFQNFQEVKFVYYAEEQQEVFGYTTVTRGAHEGNTQISLIYYTGHRVPL